MHESLLKSWLQGLYSTAKPLRLLCSRPAPAAISQPLGSLSAFLPGLLSVFRSKAPMQDNPSEISGSTAYLSVFSKYSSKSGKFFGGP
ncbi:hypothetical protein [Polaromonas naphthalenivorans]|uniref:hypothetical protein n=1 Tax=Polaromonas naphthalenivorans TaxID=216465 RepID=UPI0012EE7124|nr:hypothetical protein [Polaromonas naphthalenivorans]